MELSRFWWPEVSHCINLTPPFPSGQWAWRCSYHGGSCTSRISHAKTLAFAVPLPHAMWADLCNLIQSAPPSTPYGSYCHQCPHCQCLRRCYLRLRYWPRQIIRVVALGCWDGLDRTQISVAYLRGRDLQRKTHPWVGGWTHCEWTSHHTIRCLDVITQVATNCELILAPSPWSLTWLHRSLCFCGKMQLFIKLIFLRTVD